MGRRQQAWRSKVGRSLQKRMNEEAYQGRGILFPTTTTTTPCPSGDMETCTLCGERGERREEKEGPRLQERVHRSLHGFVC